MRPILGAAAILALPSILASGGQEPSYNGLPRPESWPPQVTLSRKPLPPPSYLTSPPKHIPIDLGRQLFVDDFLIENTKLERRHHVPDYHPSNPVLKSQKVWEKDKAAPFSDGVWFDPKDNLFKMFYWARGDLEGKPTYSTCLATSRDGIVWEKPTFDVVPGTNIVVLDDPAHPRNSGTVWLDGAEKDPERRFKMFQNQLHKSGPGESGGWRFRVRFSGDGIHWTDAGDSDHTSDRSTVFYNPFRRVWVASLRRGDKENVIGRYRAYFEAADPLEAMHWETRSGQNRAVDWVGADELDPDRLDLPLRRTPDRPWDLPPSQLYNLDCIAYESVLLGFFSILRGHQVPPLAKINEVCVGYSRDGFQWSRPMRKPFCPLNLNQPGWNAGNLQSAAGGCLVVGDKLYFYVGAVPHGTRNLDPANVGLAVLRRDGFTSLRAEAAIGTITTRAVTFKGRHLFVNAACPKGELRAEVLDEKGEPLAPFTAAACEPIAADSTRVAIRWKGAADLSSLAGRAVKFRFHLANGDLYAFWVSPEATGASHGYVAAGGPGFTGPTDDVGDPSRK